jgi:hypothetical protein
VRAALGFVAGAALIALGLAACESGESVLSGRAVVGGTPWRASEEARYRLMDGDDEIGDGVLAIEVAAGQTTFRQTFDSEEFRDETTAVTDSATLAPVSVQRVIDGPEGERRWDVTYGDSSVVIDQRSEEDERQDRLSFPSHSYDSWTDVFLWRTIDFGEDYETTYVDVLTAILAKPEVISQKLEVERKETVEVPAGTFEAWRLKISSDDGDQTAWYADTPQRPLVRYDNGRQVFELVSLESTGD